MPIAAEAPSGPEASTALDRASSLDALAAVRAIAADPGAATAERMARIAAILAAGFGAFGLQSAAASGEASERD